MDRYRVIVTAIGATGAIGEGGSEQRGYRARVPEVPGCEATAPTRAEAIEAVERELAAQLENMREAGVAAPTPVDDLPLDGVLAVKVSPALHRDLCFQAKAQQMELPAYLAELLARMAGAPRREHAGPPRDQDQRNDQGRRGGRRGGSGPSGQRYHNIMENRADFIEYVRQLDNEGGSGGRGGGGGRRGGR